jgi:hypothetical protein
MRCERFWIYTTFLITLSCSRETPAPPETTPVPPATATATATAPTTPAITETMALPPDDPATVAAVYGQAMDWLRSAPAFQFVLDEGPLHAQGRLIRSTVGKESVQFQASGEEWRATTTPRGVSWEKKKGNAWIEQPSPDYGNRLFQRVTLAFDPQKKEGAPQFVATEGTANHYRFTNANTGEVHDLWINTADKHVERMKIGDGFEMKITPGGK